MVQPSPYTPGEIAREVPGRDKQLAEIGERLSYMTELQRLVGRIRVDHAPRGIGKTSLLRQAQHRAEEMRAATVWVTAGEAIALVPAIASEIERGARGWDANSRRRVRTALEHLDLKVAGGLPGVVSVEATWHANTSRPSPVALTGAAREFEDLVAAAVDAGREHGRRGLVLLVDEVQAADPESLRTLSYAWQHFQSERPDLPTAVFAAGLPDSVALINQAVSNSERFAYRQLDDLPHDAALIALVSPARRLEVAWEPDALEMAVEYAAGYPHTLQLVGDNTWREAGWPDPGAQLTTEHVRHALESVAEDIEELYTARLSKVTNLNDVLLVRTLASLGDGPARRADLADAMGMTSDALGVPRSRLRGAGIITDTAHGYIAFTIPGFAEHVRRTLGVD